MKLSPQMIDELVAKGATLGPLAMIHEAEASVEIDEGPIRTMCFVEPSVMLACTSIPSRTILTASVPVQTASETNAREWKGRSRRTVDARLAVSRTFGPRLKMLAHFADAYHRNEALRIRFIRLGGRKMDKSNLPAAMKSVEDAMALMMGADDGDPRWHAEFDQETEGAVGVRIEIARFD